MISYSSRRFLSVSFFESFRPGITSSGGKITAADVLGLCYMEDDHTVTALATGTSVAGIVVRVDNEGVAVECGGYIPVAAAATGTGG